MTDVRVQDQVRAESRWAATAAAEVLSTWAKRAPAGSSDGTELPGTIVFGSGNPDPATLPSSGLLAAAQRALEDDVESALLYGPMQGDPLLRQWLADRLNDQEDAGATAENFLITGGSGQAIQMSLQAFADPGDAILVEMPSYSGAMRIMRAHGLRLEGVEMDDEGVLPEALDDTIARLVARGRAPKLFYTMPTFHNPAGMTTPLSRREAVVEICDRHRVMIVEDDAYGEIRVEGPRLPSYYKLTGGHGALRLSTVSKMLATGLRVGWVTGREDFITTMTTMRNDGGLNPWLLRTVTEFFVSGDEDRHLEKMIPIYREKRDRMLAALSERCARHVTWTQPEGGFFVWLKLNDHIDPARLPNAMSAEGVFARPGTQFYHDGSGEDHVRLCFSTETVADIEEGIRRLGRALDESVR